MDFNELLLDRIGAIFAFASPGSFLTGCDSISGALMPILPEDTDVEDTDVEGCHADKKWSFANLKCERKADNAP